MWKIVSFIWISFLSAQHLMAQVIPRPEVILGKRNAVTKELRKWKPNMLDPKLRIKTRDEKGLIFARDMEPLQFTHYGSRHSGPDPLWQKEQAIHQGGNAIAPTNTSAQQRGAVEQGGFSHDQSQVGLNFEGIGFANVAPGDPTIAVGPNHIIQMVNGQNGSAYFWIYQKNGQSLGTQAFMDQLPGSSYNGAGDCIAWYDQLADRYVMSEFGDSSATGASVNSLIIAVSQTPDPLGAWYVYEFTDASFFPDYPKFSNWHDAWYGMTRDFEGAYVGNSVWAFNKFRMLAGDSVVEVQRFRFNNADNVYNSLCPVSLAGSTPAPTGTPGYFLYYNDDNFTSSATDTDSLGVISFKVDFANPANSVARIETSLPVAPFRSIVCGSRNCAPSPSGNGYDVIASRIMNRPYYRNFGTYQAIVANHTVDATGNAVSGIRWYELRNTGSNWGLHQQGTFAPQDNFTCGNLPTMHRFMGTTAINAHGQIALAYNSSSTQRFASISFTGRNASDPLNLMSYSENDAFIATGYGTFGNRWGDYNEMVPDPIDDSLFWFCGMYGGTSSAWQTRIISFRLAPNPPLDASVLRIEYPNNCESFCSQLVQPRIRIRNNGSQTLTSAVVRLQINQGPVQQVNWNGLLEVSEETVIVFPPTTLPAGLSQLKAYINSPNGGQDQNLLNDTASTTLSINEPAALPYAEGFESEVFPPTGWSQTSTGSGSFRWNRTTAASRFGAASLRFDNFNNNEPTKYADLRTPLLDVSASDSLSLQFWLAAALYDPVTSDTLEILVSDDCGASFHTVWKKWGAALATRPGAVNAEYVPTMNEWQQVSIDLSAYAGREKIIITFRNINNFGNNIYLDNIQLNKYLFPSLDASILAITEPLPVVCTPGIEPVVNIVNLGKDTLRSIRIQYTLDNGQSIGTNWTGALSRLAGSSVKLPASPSGTGNRILTVSLSEANGAIDENLSNDTARLPFGVKAAQAMPLRESFEGTSFPTAQWNLVNPDKSLGWTLTREAAQAGNGALLMNNFSYPVSGLRDEVISPLLSYSNVDSVFLQFQLAAATRVYPGSTGIPLDTLEVLVSVDCGRSYSSVYKKWGTSLQTVGDGNSPTPTAFFPRSQLQWRKEKLNLTSLLGSSNSFIINFRNTSNGENNIFIDEVEAFTLVLPVRLKSNGFLVSPNPFRDQFQLQFYPDANSVRSVEVYNALGQKVYLKEMNQGAWPSAMQVNLRGQSAGMYNVRIVFSDRVETVRVVKQ